MDVSPHFCIQTNALKLKCDFDKHLLSSFACEGMVEKTIKTSTTLQQLRNDLLKVPEQTFFIETDTHSPSNTPTLWPMSHSGLQWPRRHGLTRTVSTPNSLSAPARPCHSQLSKWQVIKSRRAVRVHISKVSLTRKHLNKTKRKEKNNTVYRQIYNSSDTVPVFCCFGTIHDAEKVVFQHS